MSETVRLIERLETRGAVEAEHILFAPPRGMASKRPFSRKLSWEYRVRPRFRRMDLSNARARMITRRLARAISRVIFTPDRDQLSTRKD